MLPVGREGDAGGKAVGKAPVGGLGPLQVFQRRQLRRAPLEAVRRHVQRVPWPRVSISNTGKNCTYLRRGMSAEIGSVRQQLTGQSGPR